MNDAQEPLHIGVINLIFSEINIIFFLNRIISGIEHLEQCFISSQELKILRLMSVPSVHEQLILDDPIQKNPMDSARLSVASNSAQI